MNETSAEPPPLKHKPAVWLGILLYVGYLTVFFTTWIVNKVDYSRLGANADTIKLWYALPTLFGCTFLVAALSVLGWWRAVLFDPSRSGPRWGWILPIVMTAIIFYNLVGVPYNKLSGSVLLWAALGAVGVGFGEEMITRGSMILGLRSRFSETKVWLFSALLFSALHIPNAFFGIPLDAVPVQVVLTFMMGSGFYVMRRISGTLILPMVLHGLWDSSLLLNEAAEKQTSDVQFIVYPLAIICVIGVLREQRKHLV